MAPTRIFLTGASGCVGHYLVEQLLTLPEYELILLVRNPAKVPADWHGRPGVTLVQGDLTDLEPYRDLLPTVDVAILTATAWGGDSTYRVNVDGNLGFVQALDPNRCQQVIYFSTASLLNRQQEILPQCFDLGTDYIRSKALCHQQLVQMPVADRLTVIFPTLVFGGEPNQPASQLTAGLDEVLRWLPVLRWLRVDTRFHFIHAQDLARIVVQLIQHPSAVPGPRQVVVGSPCVTFNQVVREMCAYFDLGRPWGIPLPERALNWLAHHSHWFGVHIGAWDLFCLDLRYFCYDQALHPTRWGLPATCTTVADLLKASGYAPGRPGWRALQARLRLKSA